MLYWANAWSFTCHPQDPPVQLAVEGLTVLRVNAETWASLARRVRWDLRVWQDPQEQLDQGAKEEKKVALESQVLRVWVEGIFTAKTTDIIIFPYLIEDSSGI